MTALRRTLCFLISRAALMHRSVFSLLPNAWAHYNLSRRGPVQVQEPLTVRLTGALIPIAARMHIAHFALC